MGHLLAVLVLAADISDRDGADLLLPTCYLLYPWLQKLWADSSYQGDLEADFLAWYQITLAIVSKPPHQQGFAVLPRRWVVERTFAWLNFNRRLSKDYEVLTKPSETMIYIAMTRLMLRRLKPL